MKLPRKLLKHWHGLRKRRENRLYQEQWLLGFLPLPDGEHAGRALAGLAASDFRLLEPPTGIFHADPFLVRQGDRVYCFYEASPLHPVFGHIEVVVLDLQGQVIEAPRAALRCNYHLSYPQVFRHDGRWYMLPETSANNTIELWVAESFPDRWTRHAVLVDGIAAADATLHQEDDRWWLLAAVRKDCRKFGDRLWAWHADSPLSTDWTPHAANPVRSGILHDRPAGELFRHQGRLIRPVQDSVKRYGGAVEFREVTTLTPDAYAEHEVARLEFPRDSGYAGVHTINACPGMLVIDLLRLVPRAPVPSPAADCRGSARASADCP